MNDGIYIGKFVIGSYYGIRAIFQILNIKKYVGYKACEFALVIEGKEVNELVHYTTNINDLSENQIFDTYEEAKLVMELER